ncbi:hypothetical protein POPTR_011G137800v4 [Populus trichocarpa]|uniref:Uncharacterized protein n=1 Tax=Populus trichocarpa TaxID=3694 RepID=A0ACC0SA24_POPTR|nr:hypothetical protein BDE02_11G120100 [Populus trichocarpa]KAI9385977.1 hypothetical protein POPTR_011G137800v4 [Populus trichocarpa]
MNTLFIVLTLLIPIFLLLTKGRRSPKRVPPGSLGIPIVGHSLHLLRAMRANTAEKWLQQRIQIYGPISKLSLFGKPTVFIHGKDANKFVFTSDSSTLSNSQPQSVKKLLGDRCLLELSGQDHKRVRDALGLFLKPESLKSYVGKMDEEVRMHIAMHWEGKQEVKVLPLMKTLTFNIICALLFGIERGARREKLVDWFQEMMEGMWSIPINLPFTRYNRSLQASASIRNMTKDLIGEKRMELAKKGVNPHKDLISCMLSTRDENNREVINENEIMDNVMLVMTAGHDTSSILITCPNFS